MLSIPELGEVVLLVLDMCIEIIIFNGKYIILNTKFINCNTTFINFMQIATCLNHVISHSGFALAFVAFDLRFSFFFFPSSSADLVGGVKFIIFNA